MTKFNIQDGSSDKKYFTIIPNYVLNHSTLWDREVYIQMKRIAGEEGSCWVSRNSLVKQCGISLGRLQKSIKYLIEHRWIEFIGKKTTMTKGGFQDVNEYKICDLWNTNNEFYKEKHKGGSSGRPPHTKGGSQHTQRGVTAYVKGGSPSVQKEEPIIRTTKNSSIEDVLEKTKRALKEVNAI